MAPISLTSAEAPPPQSNKKEAKQTTDINECKVDRSSKKSACKDQIEDKLSGK